MVVHAENGRMDCEVVSRPNRNGTVDRGLFQLNSAYYPYIPDCYENVRKAHEIYRAWGGFHAWSAYNNKSYLKFKDTDFDI